MSILEIAGLEKTYEDGTNALDGIGLEVESGEFLAIIGSSGAGKSTMLRCINQLVEPTGGQCRFDGMDLSSCSGKQLRAARQDIGMVFQQFNLVDRLTAIENVLTGDLSDVGLLNTLLKRFPESDQKAAYSLLSRVGIADQATQRADTLSGGQQQRVGLARMMYQSPKVILADEPIASLDPQSAETVMEQLHAYCRDESVPVLVNLHQVDIALDYADRVVGLSDGTKVYDGPTDGLDEHRIDTIYDESIAEVSDGTISVEQDQPLRKVTDPA